MSSLRTERTASTVRNTAGNTVGELANSVANGANDLLSLGNWVTGKITTNVNDSAIELANLRGAVYYALGRGLINKIRIWHAARNKNYAPLEATELGAHTSQEARRAVSRAITETAYAMDGNLPTDSEDRFFSTEPTVTYKQNGRTIKISEYDLVGLEIAHSDALAELLDTPFDASAEPKQGKSRRQRSRAKKGETVREHIYRLVDPKSLRPTISQKVEIGMHSSPSESLLAAIRQIGTNGNEQLEKVVRLLGDLYDERTLIRQIMEDDDSTDDLSQRQQNILSVLSERLTPEGARVAVQSVANKVRAEYGSITDAKAKASVQDAVTTTGKGIPALGLYGLVASNAVPELVQGIHLPSVAIDWWNSFSAGYGGEAPALSFLSKVGGVIGYIGQNIGIILPTTAAVAFGVKMLMKGSTDIVQSRIVNLAKTVRDIKIDSLVDRFLPSQA